MKMKPTTIVHKNIFVVMMISEVKCRPGLFFFVGLQSMSQVSRHNHTLQILVSYCMETTYIEHCVFNLANVEEQ